MLSNKAKGQHECSDRWGALVSSTGSRNAAGRFTKRVSFVLPMLQPCLHHKLVPLLRRTGESFVQREVHDSKTQ